MNAIRAIRERLKLTQEELGVELGCTQGNISFYERGQEFPPSAAKKLIALAASKGVKIGYDDIYGAPKQEPKVRQRKAA